MIDFFVTVKGLIKVLFCAGKGALIENLVTLQFKILKISLGKIQIFLIIPSLKVSKLLLPASHRSFICSSLFSFKPWRTVSYKLSILYDLFFENWIVCWMEKGISFIVSMNVLLELWELFQLDESET